MISIRRTKLVRTWVIPTISLIMLLIFSSTAGNSAPLSVVGDISIPADVPASGSSENVTRVVVEGHFVVTEKNGADAVLPISASLSISSGAWDASLSKAQWDNVQRMEENSFTVTVTVPGGVSVGDSASYQLNVRFVNSLGQESGSAQAPLTVRVDTMEEGVDDDDGDDDDGSNIIKDDSMPLWPIFIIGVVVVLIAGAFWFFKNYEIVRELDSERKIRLREKDTGRIIGKDRK
ncbi:MAG: hypothetical protein ACMUIE_07325 [Thermoplasmatota archaeon]